MEYISFLHTNQQNDWTSMNLKDDSIKQKNMTLSIEEAKIRLADYNILLKYMSFLQNNGLSECGKGQIIGQISLLQEYLQEGVTRQVNNNNNNNNENSYQPQQEKEQEKQQQVTIKDPASTGKVAKMMTEELQENALNTTTSSKSGLLRQVGNLVEKAKDITMEENNEIDYYARIDNSNKSQLQKQKETNERIRANNNNNKETDESWINKIKRATEVENWK
jgi:hypothetical protein